MWVTVVLIEAVNPMWKDLGEKVRADLLLGDSSTRRSCGAPRSG